MPAIANLFVEETAAASHFGDGDWQDGLTIPGSSFVSGATYLIICKVQIGGQSISDRFGFRFVNGTTPTVFTGANFTLEPGGTTFSAKHCYAYAQVYTPPSTEAERVVTFQYRTITTVSIAVRAETQVIVALRLDEDLATPGDYVFDEDTTGNDHTESFQNGASITFTPATAGEDWLIMACYQWEDNNNAQSAEYRINRDSDTEVAPFCSHEGENNEQQIVGFLLRPFNLSADSHTFTLQYRDDGSGTHHRHSRSFIFALRLQAFEDQEVSWDETEHAHSGTDWEELAALDFTPIRAGDWWIIGQAIHDVATAGRALALRPQINGVTNPVGQDDQFDTISYDATDEMLTVVLTRENLAASAQDLDLDGLVSGTPGGSEDISFVAFSMELQPAVTRRVFVTV